MGRGSSKAGGGGGYASAMIGAESPAEFWMNMSPEQQAAFIASGENINELYNRLKDTVKQPESEWRAASPGGPQNFKVGYNLDGMTPEIRKEAPHKNDGWQAEAGSTNVIRVRSDGVQGGVNNIIAHEAGHQLSNIIPGLGTTIMMNPGDVFGRYNVKRRAFAGVFGEYSPEEAFATCVSEYYNRPKRFKTMYPKAYKAIDNLFKSTPSAKGYIDRAIEAYNDAFK